MTSGYILIGAILILGGIIAVSGDRIGTRVGKARLTLFKLRPRQTATLVTIVTGTLISASVLTLIFGTSEQLRVGVFDLQKIQRKLSDTKENLARALEQKDRVQRELEAARDAQSEAKDLLSGIDRSLKDELLKQSIAAQNFKNTERQLKTISTQRNDLVSEVAEIANNRDDLKAQQEVIATQVREFEAKIDELENVVIPIRSRIASNEFKRSQLQQQLDTIHVEQNLVRQIQRLQTYDNNAKKLTLELEDNQTKLTNLEDRFKTHQAELVNLDIQLKQLNQKLAVRQAQLSEKNRQHQKLEREFQTRVVELKLRNVQLKKLEAQVKSKGKGLASLEKEVDNIEQEYRKIRQGNIVVLRNQVLATSILKVSNLETATKGIKDLLTQANLNVLQATNPDNPDPNRQIVEFTPDLLIQLKQQIADSTNLNPRGAAVPIEQRRDYVVRVFSTGNYVVGDRDIQVFIDATPNQKLFDRNTKIASVTIDPSQLNEDRVRQQLNILLVTAQLRARRVGILEDRPQIGDGQLTTYVQFLEQIYAQKYPIEIRAIVDRDIYTSGPLAIKLQAISNNKVLFSTYSNAAINSSSVH